MPPCYKAVYHEHSNPYDGFVPGLWKAYVEMLPDGPSMCQEMMATPMRSYAFERKFLMTQECDDFSNFVRHHEATIKNNLRYFAHQFESNPIITAVQVKSMTLSDVHAMGEWCEIAENIDYSSLPASSNLAVQQKVAGSGKIKEIDAELDQIDVDLAVAEFKIDRSSIKTSTKAVARVTKDARFRDMLNPRMSSRHGVSKPDKGQRSRGPQSRSKSTSPKPDVGDSHQHEQDST